MLAHRPATAQRSPTHRAVSFSYGHPPLFDERAEPAGFFSPAANSGSPSVAAAADSGGAAASSSFNPSGLKCVNTLSGHHSGILSITVGHGRVYTGSYDNTIKVWNLDSGVCETTLEGHVAWVRSLLAHAREPLLFSGSDCGLIKVWRVGAGADDCKLITSLLGYGIQPACESSLSPPSGRGGAEGSRGLGAASGPGPGSGSGPGLFGVGLFVVGPPPDVSDGAAPRPGSARPGSASAYHSSSHSRPPSAGRPGTPGGGRSGGGGVLSLAMHYGRNLLLAGSHGAAIFVWALPSYSLLLKLQGHRSAVKQLVLHGDVLFSGSYDRTIKWWDLSNRGELVGSLGTRGAVWVLAVHDGLVLAAVGDSSIKVWELSTWNMVATLSGHRGLVLALAVHGDRLISASDDRTVRVWRMRSWECERVLTGHNGGVVGVCVFGGSLVSASSDSLIKVWNSTGIQRPLTATGSRGR